MTHEIDELVIGTRFEVNELGAAQCPTLAGKTGTVTGISRRNTGVAVLFDGTTRPTFLHRDYITPISRNGSGPARTFSAETRTTLIPDEVQGDRIQRGPDLQPNGVEMDRASR